MCRLEKIGENVKLMKKVAITGTVNVGKSTVGKVFKKLGAYVVDADLIVHRLLSQKTEARNKVIRLLGEKVLTSGKIDRKKVSK